MESRLSHKGDGDEDWREEPEATKHLCAPKTAQISLNVISTGPSAQPLLGLIWDNPAHIQMWIWINGLIFNFSYTELPDFKFLAAEQKPLYQNAQKIRFTPNSFTQNHLREVPRTDREGGRRMSLCHQSAEFSGLWQHLGQLPQGPSTVVSEKTFLLRFSEHLQNQREFICSQLRTRRNHSPTGLTPLKFKHLNTQSKTRSSALLLLHGLGWAGTWQNHCSQTSPHTLYHTCLQLCSAHTELFFVSPHKWLTQSPFCRK